jgi:voltage-gated potassium channel
MHTIVFESDTPGGRAFDVALLWAILASVVLVSLDSVQAIRAAYGPWLVGLEWLLTGLFTVEYVLRLVCVARPGRYARSFFGIVDLCALLPGYLALVLPSAASLIVIRTLRLLRIFRILKLAQFNREARVLIRALQASRSKITVFLLAISTLIIISGAVMYVIEGNSDSGFTSIPESMYWAVVTMTTVGYGDIAPTTTVGQMFASLLMISGYAIIAVPTGIVSAEMVRVPTTSDLLACPACDTEGHVVDARFCRRCGAALMLGPAQAADREAGIRRSSLEHAGKDDGGRSAGPRR